jgi:hypothetical protein
LKIIFEQGYRFFCGHGSPPYFLFGEVSGKRNYTILIRIKVGGILESAVNVDIESTYEASESLNIKNNYYHLKPSKSKNGNQKL